MSKDIGPIIEGWDFSSNDVSVRIIKGDDGKDKIQMRIDLGLMQMELDGRPDGKNPFGFESYYMYFKDLLNKHREKHKSDENFILNEDDCRKLQNEALQYYHRYLCFFQLEEYDKAKRDTERNLRVFDFARKYVEDEDLEWSFQQYRPYVIMMNIRARASISLRQKNYDDAEKLINMGIRQIERFYDEYLEPEELEESIEIEFLEQWLDTINHTKPLSQKQRLEKDLFEAIKRQEYEKAADLRDKIKNLKKA